MTLKIAKIPGWLMFLILMGSMIIGAKVVPPFGMAISLVVYGTWLYSLGIESLKLNPKELAIPKIRLLLSLLFAITYAITSDYLWAVLGQSTAVIHVLAMVCIFYTAYFIAKSLRNAELKRSSTFKEYITTFFAVWFFPIGVWFLQSRMRNLIK